MLHLIQIMTYMFSRLEYTEDEVRIHFDAILNHTSTLPELLDVIGLEHWSPAQMERIMKALPRYESALNVTMMRLDL